MTKRFPSFLASCCWRCPASAPQVLAQEAQPLDRIAAVVDEDVILQSELQRAIANIKAQYAGRENQLPPEDVLSRQVLERLVLVKLQVARAQGSGIRSATRS
jgi:peptidyl-prolyl cis-trans isomerase SurA